MSKLRFRVGSVVALVLLFGFLGVSNFIPKADRVANPLLRDNLLRLGLDLQGGIHWVVGVDLEAAIDHEINVLKDQIEAALKDDQVTLRGLAVVGQTIRFSASQVEDIDKIRAVVDDYWSLEVQSQDDLAFTLVPTTDKFADTRENTMRQVLEVLRRRIDDPVRGIPDSVVARQGSDRVLVQIPGGQIDRERARALLKSTGFLEFKMVHDVAENEELLIARHPEGIPRGQMIATERDKETERVIRAYLVNEIADLTGDYLADARVGFDNQQRPIVNFTFNPEGGKLFGDLTESNLRGQLAIILDKRVYSAPTIQSRITSRGQITGRFSSQEAADLAVVLRAGSLSVPVVIEEERSVGPALGQDSIDAGLRASLVGLVLVVFFTVGYYRMSGGYASIALAVNLVLLLGLMSLFEATLTLPGIAGLVLTVGMAVDANVIIFERIREELHTGKATRAAIATGFQKATWTVLDANITTLITAVVLFEFGTGPVKGFAVTLSVGILTSVFAALVVTRLLYQLYPGNRPVEQLSI